MVRETELRALHILGKVLALPTPHTKSKFSMRKHGPKKGLRQFMVENNNDDHDKYFRSIQVRSRGQAWGHRSLQNPIIVTEN